MKFDRRASLGFDPAKNPYLQLSEADRLKFAIRWFVLAVFAVALFAVIGWLIPSTL